ncbi:epoxide hydrolase-like protein [Hypomontagnella monticulosa]|nr:epoxide hydrolase-like protein [Hypomontagnella monticulosa]
MEGLQKQVTVTSRFEYTHYSSAFSNDRETLFLLHGFPDDALLWKGIVEKLGTGYNLIIPDLLGYSGASKPIDPVAYNYADYTQDLVDILDAKGINQVIAIGHDWGSMVAQRLYLLHPARVKGLVLLNVGYVAPSNEPFDLKKFNAQTEKAFGYPLFAYQEFLTSDEAPRILNANPGRFFDGLHGAPADGWMKEFFCTRGRMRDWLLDEHASIELLPYAQDPRIRQAFVERFQRDGFEAPLCYYKIKSIQKGAADEMPKESLVVRVPTLHVICTRDAVCLPQLSQSAKANGLLPDLEEATIECGHWSPLEKPDEISSLIKAFLARRFSS